MFSIKCDCCDAESLITNTEDLTRWVGRKGAFPYVAAYCRALAAGPRTVEDLEANPPPGSNPGGGHMRYTKQRLLVSRAGQAFDPEGTLQDEKVRGELAAFIAAYAASMG